MNALTSKVNCFDILELNQILTESMLQWNVMRVSHLYLLYKM